MNVPTNWGGARPLCNYSHSLSQAVPHPNTHATPSHSIPQLSRTRVRNWPSGTMTFQVLYCLHSSGSPMACSTCASGLASRPRPATAAARRTGRRRELCSVAVQVVGMHTGGTRHAPPCCCASSHPTSHDFVYLWELCWQAHAGIHVPTAVLRSRTPKLCEGVYMLHDQQAALLRSPPQ